MRVLITGAAGFIGSHIADALALEGHEVIGIDNLTTGRRENFSEMHSSFVFGDIVNRDAVKFPFHPADVIYHCAASYRDRDNWERDTTTNVLGTINVVREAQRTGAKIVYFQTSLCYGPNPKSPVTPDAPLDPHGSYAISKTAAEQYISDSGVPYVSLRLANIYGPRNLSGPVPTFFKRLDEGQPCTVVDTRRDLVFIDDLVGVAVKAATSGSGVYHVSSGTDVSIADLYTEIVKAMKIEAPEPSVIERGKDDVATLLLSPTLTQKEFGWTAKTPLHRGIAEAVRWYKTHGVTETYTHLALKG